MRDIALPGGGITQPSAHSMAPPCMPVFEVHLREIDLRVPRRSSVNLPQLHNVESRCGREGGRERRERRDAPPLNKRRRKRPNSSLYYVEQLARRRRRLTDRSPLKTSRRGKTKGSLRHLRCRQNGESRAVFLPIRYCSMCRQQVPRLTENCPLSHHCPRLTEQCLLSQQCSRLT